MEKKISYLSKTFEDYKNELIAFTQSYYPELAKDLDDASIGTWLIEMVAAIGDNLSYYIDRVYNEANIDSAQQKNSIFALARNNGFKIPGPKGAITELQFTCELPVSVSGSPNSPASLGMPSFTFAPVIKKGTRVATASGQYFETNEDVDFTEQFNSDGESNRDIIPLVDSNNNVRAYRVTKTCTATAGNSKIYKLVISPSQVKPFMEIIIPDRNVIEVESIILKDGTNFQSDPLMSEFMMPVEFISAQDNGTADTYRFFEVDSLTDLYRWGDEIKNVDGNPVPVTYEFSTLTSGGDNVPVIGIAKGAWRPITQKFITEYTDNGYLKIIFGGGDQAGHYVDIRDASFTTKRQVSNMIYNNSLGKIPKSNTTMFIRYKVGGGVATNVAANTINTITYLDAVNKNCPTNQNDNTLAAAIITSIRVTNISPSVSGKDAPNVDEIRYMIKYSNAAQGRCITLKDYEDRVKKLPSRYGCPFRVGVIEENNKVMMYLLMVNNEGKLNDSIPSVLITNIFNYLSMYRSLNDYVEIKSGRIINVSIEVDAYIDKNYNVKDVVNNMIQAIKQYMDINKHTLGEDIYVGDLQKEIGKVDGVLNIMDMRVFNETGQDYSQTKISQQIKEDEDGEPTESYEVDLYASDYILNSESDEMFEIKYPDKDIRIKVKAR